MRSTINGWHVPTPFGRTGLLGLAIIGLLSGCDDPTRPELDTYLDLETAPAHLFRDCPPEHGMVHGHLRMTGTGEHGDFEYRLVIFCSDASIPFESSGVGFYDRVGGRDRADTEGTYRLTFTRTKQDGTVEEIFAPWYMGANRPILHPQGNGFYIATGLGRIYFGRNYGRL